MLTIINATPLGLDADLKQMFNAGFDTFIAYMKAWSAVQSTRKLMLNWNANAAWDPAQIFISALYIDFYVVY
jgi:hypothetical protein